MYIEGKKESMFRVCWQNIIGTETVMGERESGKEKTKNFFLIIRRP